MEEISLLCFRNFIKKAVPGQDYLFLEAPGHGLD